MVAACYVDASMVEDRKRDAGNAVAWDHEEDTRHSHDERPPVAFSSCVEQCVEGM